MTSVKRRTLLNGMAAGATLLTLPAITLADTLPGPLPGKTTPITTSEREARIEQARRLMRARGIRALIVEPGSSLIYFTGIQWWRSERVTAAVIPLEGDVVIVTPFFEAPSIRQTLNIPAEIRTWNEDENPLALIAGALRERGAASGPVAIEETVRYFIVDGLKKALPSVSILSGAPVVRGCRMHKSATEIALMKRATDITIASYRYVIPHVKPGMTPKQIGEMMDAATIALGGSPEFTLILTGEAAAYPHGSRAPQIVRENDIVLMDCGCTVEGYQSDVSRTFVPGKATDRQRQVWNQVRQGQQVAFTAAKNGAPAGSVDDAVRRYYESLGYGPGYRLPGLSHRTGHGIGLDGHEPVNLVHGEMTKLEPGMCFSDEPGIYIPGEFGVRLEDCFHMTDAGPAWFSEPPDSIDHPA
ncbi:M24 family metallopeptidase [Acetobacter oeni]|uniref:Metallopeptidase n=1 Tax=Acetobacter oeni TaxID=304077 RepID=A0A511XMB5_9PROT|nr:Xaa-Pro peptidase family protein [Acetobacter oeni]MBB3884107.1 Xaa-Pro dipeptidase [Acetobacter oeni]GBR02572.1 Xaa-Pro aminopeptidase [Acetobacter oeni LMG 21952]GEN64090.1 metallopeptidase [Acetobacter oeni]